MAHGGIYFKLLPSRKSEPHCEQKKLRLRSEMQLSFLDRRCPLEGRYARADSKSLMNK